MIVVDASVVITALADDGANGREIRRRLEGNALCTPELMDLEFVSVLRRLVRQGKLSEGRAQDALDDVSVLPMERAGHRALLPRIWELRGNLTSYDAAYVALAELMGAPLWTGDARLANAAGPRCELVVFADVRGTD